MPLKKGQLIRLDWRQGIFEVAEDVEWCSDFNCWGSVWLVGQYPPIFTHKGGITVIN